MIPTEATRTQYTGNASTTLFAYACPVTDKSQVLVVRTDASAVDHTLVVDVDYTVNGVGNSSSATWTILYPISGSPLPADGSLLTIIPNYLLEQNTDYNNQGANFSKVIEASLDYLTIVCKQLKESINRAVKLPVGTTESSDDILSSIATSVANCAASAAAALVSQVASTASAAAALVSQLASAASAVSAAASAATAVAAAASTGAASGFTTTALTNANIALTFGTSTTIQKFTGALTGPVIINVSRTSAVAGGRFRILMGGVVVTGTNTLTIRENGASSFQVFSDASHPTLNGWLDIEFNGTAWEATSGDIDQS